MGLHAWLGSRDATCRDNRRRSTRSAGAGRSGHRLRGVLSISMWHMSAQIAERYRHGRIFLVGDAAHRFPPTGGLGLTPALPTCTTSCGSWPASKPDGWRPRCLTATNPNASRWPSFNCDQSMHNAFKLVEIPLALGVVDDVAESIAAMHDTLADPARRAGVEAAIANQAIHFDLLGLQLGHTYDGALVVPDGSDPDVLDEPARDYVPSTRPGGRLPHGWIDDGVSTLDLVDPVVSTVLVRHGAIPARPRSMTVLLCLSSSPRVLPTPGMRASAGFPDLSDRAPGSTHRVPGAPRAKPSTRLNAASGSVETTD